MASAAASRVLTVVVTYNRLELLKRCLEKLALQTRPPDEVLVVNNSSTDGTEAFLIAAGIPHITQENGGSAAGWWRGITECVTRGFDFVWLMDDDGFPDRQALSLLLESFASHHSCVSSVVVKEQAPSELVFGLPLLNSRGCPTLLSRRRKLYRLGDLRAGPAPAPLYPYAHLFNGALISAAAIDRVGNVDRSYFMYGDELDYLWRLKRAGAVVTHTGALQFHPEVSGRPAEGTRLYYYVRNTIVISTRYLDHPFLRALSTVPVALARIVRRKGLAVALGYIVGANRTFLFQAVRDGVAGRLGSFESRAAA